MCGRYSITLPPEAIREIFQAHGELPNWPVYYNAAPTWVALKKGASRRYRTVRQPQSRPYLRIPGPMLKSGRGWLQDMEGHVRCVSDHPAIVRHRRNMKDRARQQIKIPTILVLDSTMAGEHGAGMWRVAECSAGRWGIVDRPFPPGLIGSAPERYAGDMDDLKSP